VYYVISFLTIPVIMVSFLSEIINENLFIDVTAIFMFAIAVVFGAIAHYIDKYNERKKIKKLYGRFYRP